MPAFQYSAKNAEGQTVSGTIDADSPVDAARDLRQHGLLPQRIERSKAKSTRGATLNDVLDRVFLNPPLAAEMFFFRQVAAMVTAGVSLAQALGDLATRTKNRRLRRAAIEAGEHVRAGGKLSEVLRRYPWLFSGLQLSLVEAGETSGKMDWAAEQIAGYLEKDLEMRRKFTYATFYPKLVLLLVPFILNVPTLILGTPQAYFVAVARTVVPFLVFVFAVWAVFRISLQSPPIASVWDTVKLAVPVIGPTVRKFALAKFSRALAVLYAAGAPMATSLEMAAQASGNRSLESRLSSAAIPVRQGTDLHTALVRTHALTDVVESMLATGQATGQIDEMLNKAADYYEAEGDASMGRVAIVSGILILLAVAAYIGFTVITFYLGQAIQSTSGAG